MESAPAKRGDGFLGIVIATALYATAAMVVAWANRLPLSYLDAWVKFTSTAVIPVLFLLGFYLWDRLRPAAAIRWKKSLTITFIVVISLATIWLGFVALFISFVAGMTPINNVRKYDLIAGFWNDHSTAHFPRPIPADARTVRFHFDPGFLQADTIMELGYTTTPDRIDALFRKYSHRSTFTFTASTENGYGEPMNWVGENTQDPDYFTGDYTLFFLDWTPTGAKDGNYPVSHGVAISKKRCRIVFWAGP